MYRGRFEITDGTTTIDLLGKNNGAFCVSEWIPAYPAVKGEGIWMDNPLIDGRQLAIRKQANIIENITLTVKGRSQSDIYSAIRKLRQMLDKATRYWTDRNTFSTPVYMIIQYPEEAQATKALIMDYRLPRSADPFNQPMFAGLPPVVPELTLTIERGYRVPIGSICADLNYSYTIPSLLTDTFVPTQSEDDCAIVYAFSSILTGSTEGTIGRVVSAYGVGIRFRNVTIAAGSTIIRSRIIFTSRSNSSSTPPDLIIDGEQNVAPAIFSNWADFIARVRTDAKIYLDGTEYDNVWILDSEEYIPLNYGVETIIQEIIDLPGWISGNDLVLFVINNEPGNGVIYRNVALWDHLTSTEPQLYIEYTENEKSIVISDDNCYGVVIGNADKFNDIGDVMYYDASGVAYTNLRGTALPWILFPIVPAVGDILYIACNYSTINPAAEPGAHVIFDLVTAMVNATIVWEIWTGAAWVSAGVTTVDNTDGFTNLGENSVHIQTTNWAAVAVNGITAYWLRARISASAGAITAPIQQGPNEVRIASRPFIDITSIPESDFPCQLRISIVPNGAGATGWTYGAFTAYTIDEVYMASRTINRGTDFTPYINLAGYTQSRPSGISFTGAGGADTALVGSPIGYAYRYNPGASSVETDRITLAFASPAVSQYKGKFRVFLRRYGATDPDHLSYRLKLATSTGGSTPAYYQTGLITDTNDASHRIIDFGTVDFNPPVGNYQTLYLIISVVASDACDVYWEDVILMPVDEMFVHAYQRIGADVTDYQNYYDDSTIVIDGVTDDTLSAYVQQNNEVVNPFLIESNTPLEVDVSSEDIRLWFFFGSYQGSGNYKRLYYPITGASVTVEIQPKYI